MVTYEEGKEKEEEKKKKEVEDEEDHDSQTESSKRHHVRILLRVIIKVNFHFLCCTRALYWPLQVSLIIASKC